MYTATPPPRSSCGRGGGFVFVKRVSCCEGSCHRCRRAKIKAAAQPRLCATSASDTGTHPQLPGLNFLSRGHSRSCLLAQAREGNQFASAGSDDAILTLVQLQPQPRPRTLFAFCRQRLGSRTFGRGQAGRGALPGIIPSQHASATGQRHYGAPISPGRAAQWRRRWR